ncbi:hypothetical protein pb186bvf_020818 [Paramecium bursaria]
MNCYFLDQSLQGILYLKGLFRNIFSIIINNRDAQRLFLIQDAQIQLVE